MVKAIKDQYGDRKVVKRKGAVEIYWGGVGWVKLIRNGLNCGSLVHVRQNFALWRMVMDEWAAQTGNPYIQRGKVRGTHAPKSTIRVLPKASK